MVLASVGSWYLKVWPTRPPTIFLKNLSPVSAKKRPVTKTNVTRIMAQHLRHRKDSQSPVPPSSMLRERLSSVLGQRKNDLFCSPACAVVWSTLTEGGSGDNAAQTLTECANPQTMTALGKVAKSQQLAKHRPTEIAKNTFK